MTGIDGPDPNQHSGDAATAEPTEADSLEEATMSDIDEPDAFPIPVVGSVFDPEPEREKRRGQLALGAFFFLGVTVMALVLPVVFGLRTWQELEGVSNTVLPLVVGIVGTVSGFYFGSSERRR